MRRITKAQRRECVRLRVEEQVSTPTIARRVGLCNHSVYKILEDHPWMPRGQWRKRPARGEWWTKAQDDLLRQMYLSDDRADIMAELPGHTWGAVVQRASFLKLFRPNKAFRKNKRFVHPLIRQLRDVRMQRGIRRNDLARKLGYHVGMMNNWELGKSSPKSLQALVDWANALEFELILREKAKAGDVIPWPTRGNLMARR